jgi:hypothetical protein
VVKRELCFVIMDNHVVHVSRQGHPAMMRELCRQDVWCAGRVRMPSGRLYRVSGSLPNVRDRERDEVADLLSRELGVQVW